MLDGGAIRGTAIEAYLVQFALIVAYAEIEQALRSSITTRLDAVPNEAVRSLLGRAVDRLYRGPKKESLSDFMGCLGKTVVDAFNTKLDPVHVTKYGNLISNRHEIAHNRGVNLTFDELKQAVAAAESILTSFDDIIEWAVT